MASFPSSYIPTTTASATRAADALTVPVSGLTYPNSLYAEFERTVDTAAISGIIEAYATGGNRFVLTLTAGGLAQQYNNSGNVDQVNNTIAGAITVGVVTKVAARTSTNDSRQAKDGTLGTQDISCANPTTPTALWFGRQAGGAELFGYLRRAAIWNRALTDAELQSVSST